MIIKKVPVVPFLLIALMLMAGCAGGSVTKPDDASRAISSDNAVAEATDTLAVSETTRLESTSPATEAVLTSVPSPAASASLKEGEYLILPGEGAYFNVFDSSGKVIGSFFRNSDEQPWFFGVYDENGLAEFYNEHMDELKAQIPKEDVETYLYTTLNGLYQINYDTDEVILFDKDGKKVCDIKDPLPSEPYKEICIRVLNGETVIAYQVSLWNGDYTELRTSVYIYFVAPDGTINDVCKSIDLPGKPLGLIGRQYFMVSASTVNGAEPINLYDFSGNLVEQGIGEIQDSQNTLFTSEAAMNIYIGDYYVKGQTIYGSDLKPVEADSLDKDGNLIYGIVYHVNGVECSVNEEIYDSPMIATGYKGDMVSLKTADWEFSEDLPGYRYYGMNENTIVFSKGSYLHLVSKITGQEIAEINSYSSILIGGQYIIVYEYDSRNFYILDKDGTRRYSSSASTAEPCTGEYIILHRGPYIGIADLDGNWVEKALTWELTRDEKY